VKHGEKVRVVAYIEAPYFYSNTNNTWGFVTDDWFGCPYDFRKRMKVFPEYLSFILCFVLHQL